MIAANKYLHGFVADFLSDLMNIAFSNQVAAGDQNDAIGDSVDLVENVAGDQQVHALTAKFFKEGERVAMSHGFQPVKGFSENQDARMVCNGVCQPNLLPHAFAVTGDFSPRGIA